MIYAGAGVIWGVVTVARGMRVWRDEHRSMVLANPAAPTSKRIDIPLTLLGASVVALGCTAYLFLSFYRI